MKKIIIKFLYNTLAFFARIYLKRTKPYIIGITWSVWKTSSRMIITQVLKQYLNSKDIYTSPKNFNSEIWLILSIFKIEKYSPTIQNIIKLLFTISLKSLFQEKEYDILILEYWVDHPWDMDFLLKIAKPDIGIFTKLDNVHVEYFKNKRSIWKEKFKLITSSKDKVYLNYLDDFCKNNSYKIKTKKEFYFWENIKSSNYKLQTEKWSIIASFTTWKKSISTNILWKENAEYIALGFNILKDLDKDIYNKLKNEIFIKMDNQAWRFNIFKWINESILIDSTYNASPESMKKMINNTYLLQRKLFPDYKVWFVLWDLRELWDESMLSHKWLIQSASEADFIITVWPEMKKYLAPQLDKVNTFISSQKAWEYLKKFINNSDEKYIILFKWSQNTIFVEEALKEVLQNKEDSNKLARQDENWMRIKKVFFWNIQ